jgi:hypothetical protein
MHLKGQNLRVELADGDGFNPSYNSGNNRVIFKIQTCQDVFDELFVFEFLPCCIHLITKSSHLGEVFCR